jgi:cell division protein FtsI (penicillin-binding protein 3)
VKDIKKDILLRVYLVYLGVFLFALLIMARAIYIQSFEKTELTEMAARQELNLFEIEAIRGNICSDDGTLLAVSVPIFDIRMDLATDSLTDRLFNNNVDSLAICLAGQFKDHTASEYKDLLWDGRRNRDRYLLLERDVTYPDLEKVRKFPIFRRGKYKGGLIVVPQYRRELPYKTLARRTIGYENEASVNRVYLGLEGSFSKYLQGINGQCLERRVSGGVWMPVDPDNQVEPQNGADIITTLDIHMQDLADRALRKELIADSADYGCVILMEVKTGYVKAIVNLGRTRDGKYEEVLNYAIQDCAEPGSTFKLASFLVALDDGKVELTTPVNTGNGITMYSGRKMEDSHKGGYGTIPAEQVFEKSSNVGTSKMIYAAYAAHPQQYIDGLYRLGINRRLDLQISGEGQPYIKNTKSRYWSALSLPWMSIGYEVALAPIHLVTLYNAVANNGVMVKPLFVKEIRKNGQVVERFDPVVINPQIVSPQTIKKAKFMLEGVVENGTATNIKTPFYRIAGKTGTAQIAQNNRGYRQDTKQVKYKGSFVGYFPAEDPKYTCMVVIVNPKKGKYYGGAISAPVFREISDKLYAHRPDILIPLPKDTTSGAFAYMHYNIPKQVIRGIMPDVTGLGLKDAVFLLEQQGLTVIVNGRGTVTRQSIPAGAPAPAGSQVVLDLQLIVKEKPKTQA